MLTEYKRKDKLYNYFLEKEVQTKNRTKFWSAYKILMADTKTDPVKQECFF